MGGKTSRDKGKRGEREFAGVCKEHGYEAHRNMTGDNENVEMG